jgi:L-ribulose-5-phosphate 3-epimerase
MSVTDRIGFMQGRLSPSVGGRIQAFPWSCWREEFAVAAHEGFRLMEWTLDHERLAENPLLTSEGRADVLELSRQYKVDVPSLTGDCFMQAPFWKAEGDRRAVLETEFLAVAEACGAAGISVIVVPLVDHGRIETPEQEDALVSFLTEKAPDLVRLNVRVAFESDVDPAELARFIARFEPGLFGVNYDIGNSAALGFHVENEMAAYGHRILTLHVNDRVRGGAIVPLGAGAADFDAVFAALARIRYRGPCILQTAPADGGDRATALRRDRDLTAAWLTRHAA